MKDSKYQQSIAKHHRDLAALHLKHAIVVLNDIRDPEAREVDAILRLASEAIEVMRSCYEVVEAEEAVGVDGHLTL